MTQDPGENSNKSQSEYERFLLMGGMTSEERFQLIMDNVKDFAIFMLNPEGRVIEWNAGAEHILRYTEKEVIGQPFVIFFTGEDAEAVAQMELRTALETGRAIDDRWHKRHDGTEFFATGITTALRDENGSLRGFAKILRDNTDRKRLEEELHARAEALAEADRRKDEFLAVLAHELRNPLAPVFNALHLLNREDADPSIWDQSLAMMERQLRQMARLVDDLMDVSRINRGKIQLQMKPVELRPLLQQAIHAAQPLIETRGLALSVSVSEQPIWLKGDETRLAQVFTNLLNNAAKYGKEGGHISIQAQLEEGQAVVRVRDDGLGIPPDFLPQIFDLFRQANTSLAHSQGGLGIGLTVVSRLVKMHGGKVEAFSEGLSKGSEFVVRLPVLIDNPHQEGETLCSDMPQKSHRLLVVDDNHDTAESLAMVMRLSGHEVRTAHCGTTALQGASDFKPEVILLDIGLPGLNGYDVAQRLSENPDFKKVVLIAVSGYGQKEDHDRSKRAGFDYHLTKPVDPDRLQELLLRLAELKQG